MRTLHDSDGARLTLGPKLGTGGEGSVYGINEQPGRAVKIYAAPLGAQQVAKLHAMVRAGDDPLRSVAAWPSALVYADATPIGFSMPLIAAARPMHELFGPRSRQEQFPDAHWSFLIHAGRNLARAFDILHERNIVIGDVNSNNVVVRRDSTARFIDCDSFQFLADGAIFRCPVGVPDYQPPELQDGSFTRIDRTPQHDRFGLAVMIFQLLFVGKHPFAGVLPPGVPGEGAIGVNVAAKRFFYAPQARRRGLRPPPGSPTLATLTPQVAALLTRAFLGEPAARPSAAEWYAALGDLESRVVVCAQNPVHRHRRDARCPWCALERHGVHYFLRPGTSRDSVGVDTSIWTRTTDADVERRWSEIAAVPVPPPVDPGLPLGRRYRAQPLRLWSARRRGWYAVGTLAFAGTIAAAIAAHLPIVAVLSAAAGLVAAAQGRPDARAAVARAWRREGEARRAYVAALRDWEREARSTRFLEERARLATIRRDLLEQRRRCEADLAAVEKARLRREWDAYLESRVIAAWHLRQIDERTRGRLRLHGIVSAADITRENLRRVPGLSQHTITCLTIWRRNVEREFRRNSRTQRDDRAVAAVKLRHLRERAQKWDSLADRAPDLRRLAIEIEHRRPALRERALELGDALCRAEADAKIPALFYKTWT